MTYSVADGGYKSDLELQEHRFFRPDFLEMHRKLSLLIGNPDAQAKFIMSRAEANSFIFEVRSIPSCLTGSRLIQLSAFEANPDLA